MSEQKRIHTGSIGQVGPWDRAETLRLTFSDGGTKLFGVAATSLNAGLVHYAQNTEYWAYSDLSSLTSTSTLSMLVESSRLDDAGLAAFLGEFDAQAPGWSQAPPPWSRMPYSYITGGRPVLFSFADPDRTNGVVMGISLVLDTNARLRGVGWHKTFEPESGYNWVQPPPRDASVTLTMVGETNNPPERLVLPGTVWWNVFQQIMLTGSAGE
jgi:hypothetical protein